MSDFVKTGSDLEGRIIRAEDYVFRMPLDKHVYLCGDLKLPTQYPFFRTTSLEFVVTSYQAGDDGLPHWHREIDEFELVLEGSIGVFDVMSGKTGWLNAGDFHSVPQSLCVKRLVRTFAKTVAVKVPSRADKVHCNECPRKCSYRVQEFEKI